MAILLQDPLYDSILQIIQSSAEPLETEEIIRVLQRDKPHGASRTKILYRLHNLRAEDKIRGKLFGSGKGSWIWWSNDKLRPGKIKAPADDDNAWPEEVEALGKIQSGKTRMVTQSADEMIAELKEIENEP
jgi:hypothetical protein